MQRRAFLFSGQGAQAPGMGKELYDAYPAAKAIFDRASAVLKRDIAALCFAGTQEELNLTENTQPCLLTVELAHLAALTARGIKPACVAGFSLGEWAALVAAQVLSVEDALNLVAVRARAMQQASPAEGGGMLVILGLSGAEVEALCAEVEGAYPCNYNCPGQVTCGGTKSAIAALTGLAEKRQIRAIPVAMSVVSHCPLIAAAADTLSLAVKDIAFADPTVPVYSNCSAKAETSGKALQENVARQLTSPVLFEKTLVAMQEAGVTHFIEVGVGKTLSGFVKKTLTGVTCSKAVDLKTLEETCALA